MIGAYQSGDSLGVALYEEAFPELHLAYFVKESDLVGARCLRDQESRLLLFSLDILWSLSACVELGRQKGGFERGLAVCCSS